MNKDALLAICQQLNLGFAIDNVTPVTGGLLHKMWKLTTSKASYAIKQLSQDIKLTPQTLQAYEITEQIAEQFKQQGIPAISAIKGHDCYLSVIANTAFLVYPWVNAKALHKDVISQKHALQIASLLAKMHTLNLHMVELEEPSFDIHADEKIRTLIHTAIDSKCVFSSLLKEHEERILIMNHAYQNATSLMKSRTVISHGDLDQKNVLWDQTDKPILIDWESARKLNPTYEIINAALDGAGSPQLTLIAHYAST